MKTKISKQRQIINSLKGIESKTPEEKEKIISRILKSTKDITLRKLFKHVNPVVNPLVTPITFAKYHIWDNLHNYQSLASLLWAYVHHDVSYFSHFDLELFTNILDPENLSFSYVSFVSPYKSDKGYNITFRLKLQNPDPSTNSVYLEGNDLDLREYHWVGVKRLTIEDTKMMQFNKTNYIDYRHDIDFSTGTFRDIMYLYKTIRIPFVLLFTTTKEDRQPKFKLNKKQLRIMVFSPEFDDHRIRGLTHIPYGRFNVSYVLRNYSKWIDIDTYKRLKEVYEDNSHEPEKFNKYILSHETNFNIQVRLMIECQ